MSQEQDLIEKKLADKSRRMTDEIISEKGAKEEIKKLKDRNDMHEYEQIKKQWNERDNATNKNIKDSDYSTDANNKSGDKEYAKELSGENDIKSHNVNIDHTTDHAEELNNNLGDKELSTEKENEKMHIQPDELNKSVDKELVGENENKQDIDITVNNSNEDNKTIDSEELEMQKKASEFHSKVENNELGKSDEKKEEVSLEHSTDKQKEKGYESALSQ